MRKRPKITEKGYTDWADQLKNWITTSVSPFEDDTKEKKEARIDRARWDKLFFMETYLPHYFSKPFGEFHDEWAEIGDIEDDCALVACPREHGKSTFFTFGDPLHDICFEERKFIIIISDTNDQATGFTLPIRLELEDNPRILHDFGKLTSKTKWTQSDFTTSNGTRILARGKGEKVRGLKNREHRPDKAIVDDFENDENVENPKLIKKGLKWLRGAVIGSLGEGFCFIMVGNLFHPKSILSQLIAEKDENGKKRYLSYVYSAIINPGKKNQRSLWPEAWPLDRLLKKKSKMGSVSFNAEMLNLVGAEGSPFPEKWRVFYTSDDIKNLELMVASFLDPSAKSGEANDYKAIITFGLDRKAMIFYCLHAWIRHATPGEMFKAAYQINDAYGGRIGIEDNMLEDFLHEAIINYARDVGRYLPWEPVHNTSNKEARIIATLAYLMEHGKLRFIEGHSDQDLLLEQMLYILNKNVNDDGPDAAEGALRLLQNPITKMITDIGPSFVEVNL
ncbi:MAG: hypothetical protein GY714_10510 [Desulfobacterales bacterium]|nr:hypothetical protein [Desulfobacterales bacterium]